MSNSKSCTLLYPKNTLNKCEKKEPFPELLDEVDEGVKGFLILITVCDVLLLLLLTLALLVTSPVLTPLGIFFIGHLLNHYCQNIKKLKNLSDNKNS